MEKVCLLKESLSIKEFLLPKHFMSVNCKYVLCATNIVHRTCIYVYIYTYIYYIYMYVCVCVCVCVSVILIFMKMNIYDIYAYV